MKDALEPAIQTPEVRHAGKVARVVAQLRAHRGGSPVSLRKRSVSHQVPKARDLRRRDQKIDVSDLDEILRIDPAARVCVAEPGVTFADLVAATLPLGLAPIIVPELESITIGGAVAGCSIESASFRYGGFHDTCLEYEVITARGEVLVCRPDDDTGLLFQMMHGSFGTLGILSRLVFRLVPARRYVHLRYQKHAVLADFLAAVERLAEAPDVDFLDGILHSPTELVLAVGRFVDRAPYTHRYDRVRVYYRTTRSRSEDYLEAADYFFRYDRGVTNVRPRSLVGRLLFGRLLHSTQWLRLGERLHWLLRRKRPAVTVDVFLPLSRAAEFLAWYQRELDHFPLWCVPYRRVRDYEWLAPSFWAGLHDRLFLDLAIYGARQRRGVDEHRLLEKKLIELGGVKTLISHNQYPEEEFWSIWNRRSYDAVKARTDPDNLFRDLYQKTCRAAMGRR